MSNRIADTRGEKALGVFLDKYFYPFFIEQEGFASCERRFDAATQKSGTDVIIKNNAAEEISIDEKAQLHYINNPKETFAFEVSYKAEEGNIIDGWFVNETNRTDCYVLVWIEKARQEALNRIVADDFEELSVCFITKKKIYSYLQSIGYGIGKIKINAKELREQKENRAIKISDECILYHSKIEYDEDPINLVISKSVLQKLAHSNFVVTKEGIFKK